MATQRLYRLFKIAKNQAIKANYLQKVYTKEIRDNYKKPKPYIKLLQILQLQFLHFVILKCFLKRVKETEVFTSICNFAHIICPMNLTVSVP